MSQHRINFELVKTLDDVKEILKALDLHITNPFSNLEKYIDSTPMQNPTFDA